MAVRNIAAVWADLGIPADYVRRWRLPCQREAARVVSVGRHPDGRIVRLAPQAARAWRRMQRAAAAAGIELLPLSGYRSVARQIAIIRGKLAAGQVIDEVLEVIAAPGCSEHHTGRAIDIGCPGEIDMEETFARTAAFRWLRRNAGRFGFYLSYPRRRTSGISYEPWHWCWRSGL